MPNSYSTLRRFLNSFLKVTSSPEMVLPKPYVPRHALKYMDRINKPDILVIGNRHSCAVDAIEQAKVLGIQTIYVLVDPNDRDAETLHARIPGVKILEVPGYTDQDAILTHLEALVANNPGQMVNFFPGYGFLAENTGFVEKLEALSSRLAQLDAEQSEPDKPLTRPLVWVGPSSQAMAKTSNKLQFKIHASTCGLPVVPGPLNSLSQLGLSAFLKDKAPGNRFKVSVEGGHEMAFTIPDSGVTDDFIQQTYSSIFDLQKKAAQSGLDQVFLQDIGVDVDSPKLDIDVLGYHEAMRRYPDQVLRIKATEGGGGKGQRVPKTLTDEDIIQAVQEARREGVALFGSGELIVEPNLNGGVPTADSGNDPSTVAASRYGNGAFIHVEIQVMFDPNATDPTLVIYHRGIRVCSIQAGNSQKFLEYLADRPELLQKLEAQMGSIFELGETLGYNSVGTLELLYDKYSNEMFLLEMNTRVQVEHKVSEDADGRCVLAEAIHLANGGHLEDLRDIIFPNEMSLDHSKKVVFGGQLRVNVETHVKDLDDKGVFQPVVNLGRSIFEQVQIPDDIPGVYVPGVSIETGQGIPQADSNIMRALIYVTQEEVDAYLSLEIPGKQRTHGECLTDSLDKVVFTTEIDQRNEVSRLAAREIFRYKAHAFLRRLVILGPEFNLVALWNGADIVASGEDIATSDAGKYGPLYSRSTDPELEKLDLNRKVILGHLHSAIDAVGGVRPVDMIQKVESVAPKPDLSKIQKLVEEKFQWTETIADRVISAVLSKLGLTSSAVNRSQLRDAYSVLSLEQRVQFVRNLNVIHYFGDFECSQHNGVRIINSTAFRRILNLLYKQDDLKFSKSDVTPSDIVSRLAQFSHTSLIAFLRDGALPLKELSETESGQPDPVYVPVVSSRALRDYILDLGEPDLSIFLQDVPQLDLFQLLTPQDFSRVIREKKLIVLFATNNRDDSQSERANRDLMDDSAELNRLTGYLLDYIGHETGGGARPTVDLRFKGVNHMPLFQQVNQDLGTLNHSLFRSTGFAYANQPIAAMIRLFKAYIRGYQDEHGVWQAGCTMPRIFDALNNHPDIQENGDYPSLSKCIKAYKQAMDELRAEGFKNHVMPMFSVVYTGALASGDTVYNQAYYEGVVDNIIANARAKGLEDGSYVISIKDMVGQMTPEDAKMLVGIIRARWQIHQNSLDEDHRSDIVVHLHMHDASGETAEVLKQSGADMMDGAFHMRSIGLGQTSLPHFLGFHSGSINVGGPSLGSKSSTSSDTEDDSSHSIESCLASVDSTDSLFDPVTPDYLCPSVWGFGLSGLGQSDSSGDAVTAVAKAWDQIHQRYEWCRLPEDQLQAVLGPFFARFGRVPGGQWTTYGVQAESNKLLKNWLSFVDQAVADGHSITSVHDFRILIWAYTYADKIMADTDDFADPYRRCTLVTPSSQTAATIALGLLKYIRTHSYSSEDLNTFDQKARTLIRERDVSSLDPIAQTVPTGYQDILRDITDESADFGALCAELHAVLRLENAAHHFLNTLRTGDAAAIRQLDINDKFVTDFIRGAMGVPNPLQLPRYRQNVMAQLGLQESYELPFDLDAFKEQLVHKGISRELINSVDEGTLIIGYMLPPEDLANYLDTLTQYGDIQIPLEAWLGLWKPDEDLLFTPPVGKPFNATLLGLQEPSEDVIISQSPLQNGDVEIHTTNGTCYWVTTVNDKRVCINQNTNQCVFLLQINGRRTAVPISYVKHVPPITIPGQFRSVPLNGSGFLKELEHGIQFGQLIQPGTVIGTQEQMKKGNEFKLPEDSPEGYLIPLRPGLAAVMAKKAADPTHSQFTIVEGNLAKFGTGHGVVGIVSEPMLNDLLTRCRSNGDSRVLASDRAGQLSVGACDAIAELLLAKYGKY